jgi:hypothetical protein
MNDFRKSAFPHYRDEITRVRFIGSVSAARLRDARHHLGADVPVASVDTVEDLKVLVAYADKHKCVRVSACRGDARMARQLVAARCASCQHPPPPLT